MNVNEIEVTKEEEEAMQALEKPTKEEWVKYGVENCTLPEMGELLPNPTTQDVLNNLAIPQPPTETPTLDTIITNICTQLQLLSTVIKEGAGKGNSLNANETETKSLQDCVSSVLENADWFEEKVREIVDSRVDDLFDSKDFDYEISNAVSAWFDDFNLNDYTDVDEIVERVVEDRLGNASINVEFN